MNWNDRDAVRREYFASGIEGVLISERGRDVLGYAFDDEQWLELAKLLRAQSSESRPSEPTAYSEIQQRIGELHGEIHRLAAKITGDQSQGVTMRATRSPYDCGPNPTKDYPGE